MSQGHELPDEDALRMLKLSKRKERDDAMREYQKKVESTLPRKTKRSVELAKEKSSSNWLTVIPIKVWDST